MDLFGILLLILILLIMIVIVWIYRQHRKKSYMKVVEEKKLFVTEQEKILEYWENQKKPSLSLDIEWTKPIQKTTIKRDLLVEYKNPMEIGENYDLSVKIIKEMGEYFTDSTMDSQKSEVSFFSREKEPTITVRARSEDFTFISHNTLKIKILENVNISEPIYFTIKPKPELSENKATLFLDVFYDNRFILPSPLEIEVKVQKKLFGTSSENGLTLSGISGVLEVVNQFITLQLNLLNNNLGTLTWESLSIIFFILILFGLILFSRAPIGLKERYPTRIPTSVH